MPYLRRMVRVSEIVGTLSLLHISNVSKSTDVLILTLLSKISLIIFLNVMLPIMRTELTVCLKTISNYVKIILIFQQTAMALLMPNSWAI